MSLTLCNYTASSPSTPNCVTCGSAIDFVSNPSTNGWYADDSSDFLYLRSGGAFNSIIEEEAIISVPCASCVGAGNYQTTTITAGGKVFRTDNTNVGGRGIIYVYDGGASPVLIQTILLNTGVYCRNMAYNPNDGLIYFSNTWNSNALNTLNPSTYQVIYDIVGNLPTIGNPTGTFVNEFTNEVYVILGGGAFGSIEVINVTGTPSLSATITAATLGDSPDPWAGAYAPFYIEFNPVNGDAWVVMKNQFGTGNDMALVDGSTYGLISFLNDSGASYPAIGAGGLLGKPIAYYPGDGTPGSDRMFVIMADSKVYEFLTTGLYTQTLFSTEAASSINVLLYSQLWGKLFVTSGSVVKAYDPQNALNIFANITLSTAGNIQFPSELPEYNQIVFPKIVGGDGFTNNLVYVGLNEDNAVRCDSGLVDMYISGDGPYFWDEATTSWISVVSSIVLSDNLPASNLFTVTATLGAYGLTACLLISTDGGVSFSPLIDTSNELYADDTVWGAGRVYNRPIGAYSIKLQINTLNDCRVLSDEITA